MLRKIPATYEEESTVDLAPCPFCGSDNVQFSNCQELELCEVFEKCPEERHYICVVCSMGTHGCGSSSGFYPTYKEAANAWNKRSGHVSVKALEALLQRNALGGEKAPQEQP